MQRIIFLCQSSVILLMYFQSFLPGIKKMYRDAWMDEAILANKVHIQYRQRQYYWLTKFMNKNHDVNGYVSHNCSYISTNSWKITKNLV